MQENVLRQAVEDISVIKAVIDRTGKSFVAFSKIFIFWGMLFSLSSVYSLIMVSSNYSLFSNISKYPIANFLFPVGLIALIAVLIYWNVTKKVPLVGLEKQLMMVWLLFLILNIIPPNVSIISPETSLEMQSIIVYSNTAPIMIFSLAIALITTSLFTGYKQLGYMGAIYIGISIVLSFVNIPMDQSIKSVLMQIPHFFALPFTFLYTGFFLKARQVRSE